jgi:hypothetical protein
MVAQPGVTGGMVATRVIGLLDFSLIGYLCAQAVGLT